MITHFIWGTGISVYFAVSYYAEKENNKIGGWYRVGVGVLAGALLVLHLFWTPSFDNSLTEKILNNRIPRI